MSKDEDRRDEVDEEESKGPPSGFLVGVYGLGLFLGCRLLSIFLDAQATASAVGQAVLVEWASSRLGVVWTDPATVNTKAAVARRAAIGVAIGLGAASALIAVLAGSHGATFESVPAVAASVIAIGVITAGLQAWRDELLLHGIVLRALGLFDPDDPSRGVGQPRDLLRVMACGATSAGAALGRSDASARSVAVAALLGVLFGALWVRDRGAWMPWAAHFAFRVAADTLINGGVTQIRPAAGAWSGGDMGLFSGTAAVVALAPVALLAMGAIVRRISPDSARVG